MASLLTTPRNPGRARGNLAAAIIGFSCFLMPLAGPAEPLRLNIPLPDFGDVLYADGFAFTPDGTTVVYSADGEEDTRHEIYAVPLEGGEGWRLNEEMPDEGDAFWSGVRISPRSDTVVFIANADADREEVNELYATSIHDPSQVKLSPPLEETGRVLTGGLLFTPDGSRVLFRAQASEEAPVHLYSVSPDGADLAALSAELPANSHVSSHGLAVTPDGSSVVFLANQGGERVWSLYSASTTGGGLRELSHSLAVGGSVDPLGVMLSPDGGSVVYRATNPPSGSVDLYMAALDGPGTSRLLAEGMVLAPGLRFVGDSGVLFLHSAPGGERSLRLAGPAGGDAPRVVARASEGWSLSTASIDVVESAGLVVYIEERFEEGDDDDDEVIRLRRLAAAPLSGGSPVILTPETDSLRGYFPLSGSGRLAVLANLRDEEKVELFSIPLTGEGGMVRLNQPLEEGGHVLSATATSDGEIVLFLAAMDSAGLHELYSVPASGGGVVRLNAGLPGRAEVHDARLSPCESWVVYTADQDRRGVIELYRASLANPEDGAVALRHTRP